MNNTTLYRGYTIHTRMQDDTSYLESPREYSQLKMCVSPHKRYSFPDELDIDWDRVYQPEDNDKDYIKDLGQSYWIIWMDVYIHSDVTFSVAGTGMRFDFDTSKACGFMAVPKEVNSYDRTLRSESKSKDKGEKISYTKEEALVAAKSDIETYNQRSHGEIYEYEIEELEQFSCGFYQEESALDDAKGYVDNHIKGIIKSHARQLKKWIKNKVPFIYRKPLSSSIN